MRIKEKYHSKSQKRLQKTLLAQQRIQEEFEGKRLKFLKKNEEIERRIEENKEFMKQEIEIKKHRDLLKQFNKEWNLMRERKKEEYQKGLICEKLQKDEKRTQEFTKAKEAQTQMIVSLAQRELLRKELLREALLKMSFTKKWDKNFIE